MSSRVISFGIMIVLLLSLTACSANAQLDVEKDHTLLTVTIPKSDVANTIRAVLESGNPSLLSNAQVDFTNGEIVVKGEYRPGFSSNPLPATLRLRLSAQNGKLQVTVTAFSIGSANVNQAALSDFNTTLAQSLQQNATGNNSESQLTNVTVSNTALSFSVKTPRKK